MVSTVGMPMMTGKTATRKTIVLLSGGLDSTCCLHFCLSGDRPVEAMFVDYGQAARVREEQAATAIARELGVRLRKRELAGGTNKGTGLVQARNAFLIVCALMEADHELTAIALGVHAGTQYWDCSQQFIAAMQSVVDGYTSGRVQLLVPFLHWTKKEIFVYSGMSQLPVHLTYSCERGDEQPCRQCLSCQDMEALSAGEQTKT